MKKQDLTSYSENELDLVVQNTEYLYSSFMRSVRKWEIFL